MALPLSSKEATALGPSLALALGAPLRLCDPLLDPMLGMFLDPAVWQQLFQLGLRHRRQPLVHVTKIRIRIHPMPIAALGQSEQRGGRFTPFFIPKE
jgi:hypothetical protein